MVYARVSKTRGCNGLESSSLSPGTGKSIGAALMCGNGTCSSCIEAARDRSHSARWNQKSQKPVKGSGDKGSEFNTDYLDLRHVFHLVRQQHDESERKKGKEQE